MNKLFFSIALLIASSGCSLTPIDSNVKFWHEKSKDEVPELRKILKKGDIIFRLSNTQLAGGLVDFSKEVANATNSDFSHAILVLECKNDGIVLVDVTAAGVTRRYLIDWYLDGCRSLAVKRLKPEYQYLIPLVLKELKKIIDEDSLYDDKFVPNDDKFYCTELVDHCFRTIGHPLAKRIKLKEWPNYNLLSSVICIIGGIDNNSETAFVGNEEIGIFSSQMLETVMETRKIEPKKGTN